MNISSLRLAHQQISTHRFSRPEELVSWMGAVQAQDFAMAKWAIGCRLPGLDEAQIDQCFQDGAILRTHVMRPTWHFVSPKDIRWMLDLSAPRIRNFARSHHRELQIDARLMKKARTIIEKHLAKHGPTARTGLGQALSAAGLRTDESRLGFFLLDAELEGLICSAGRQGKQFAYGLLNEIVPKQPVLKDLDAVRELAARYFTSHGPATIHDFSWWSGIPIGEIQKVLDSLKQELVSVSWKDRIFWSTANIEAALPAAGNYFLPAFDEYFIGYADRSDLADAALARRVLSANGIFNPIFIRKGRIAGTWKRVRQAGGMRIHVSPFSGADGALDSRLLSAAKKYHRFTGGEGSLMISDH